MNSYFKLTCNLALLCLGLNTYGQETPKNIYLGASAGFSQLSDQTSTVNSELTNAVGGTSQSSQNNGAAAYRLFGGILLNKYIAVELGYAQTANQTLTFSGISALNTNYSGSFNASYSGADLGLVLHPVQLPVFKYVFIDLGATQYKEKQLGNVSTSLGGYSQSQNQSGMGKFYGLGYDLPMGASTDLRFSLNHYDSIGGDSALKSNLASVGVTRRF